MSDLPALDSVTHCSKCGHIANARPECSSLHSADIAWKGIQDYRADGSTRVYDEHMERTCRRCGYTWKEAPFS